jgi:hypothetical protein
MATTKTVQTFNVYFKIANVEVSNTIAAPTFEDALTIARGRSLNTILEDDSLSYSDYESPVVNGIYKSN